MTNFVHFIPIVRGDRVLESIRKCGYPIQKAYLILDNGYNSKIVEELKGRLEVLVDVEMIYVNQADVYSTVNELLKTIKKEVEDGNKALINITDSPDVVKIACFISAQLSVCRIYGLLNSEVSEFPLPPVKRFDKDQAKIIKVLREQNGEVSSISKLIDAYEGLGRDKKEYMAQRARISYHIEKLKDCGIVETQKKGRQLSVRLMELGKAYSIIN